MAQLKGYRAPSVLAGDVVTLKDRIDLMTVETVRSGPFGPVVDCCWFDETDCLRFRSFPLSQLDIFPRASLEKPVGVGTEVRLRSRGPVMTVRSFRTKGELHLAECDWNGPMGAERRRLFPRDGLVLTLLERFEGLGGQEI